MTIEEKAKAYDEAKARMSRAFNSNRCTIGFMNEIFPELAESEDEKIRKTIIRFFKDQYSNETEMYDGSVTVGKAIAWLKKQGEPNPYSGTSFEYDGHTWGMCARDNGVEIIFDGELKAFLSSEKSFIYPIHPQKILAPKSAMEAIKEEKIDNANKVIVEPKFKVGDWVVSPNGVYWHIDLIRNGRYEVTADTGQCGNWQLDTNIYRLWTIEDARDGDVLDANGAPFIYKKHDKDYVYFYCGVNLAGEFIEADGIDTWNNNNKVYPATKEQRDVLFQKMHEAGYEWDAEKKKLRKCEQNSAWSEEDEKMLADACIMLDWYKGNNWWTARRIKDWLNSLKERIGG